MSFQLTDSEISSLTTSYLGALQCLSDMIGKAKTIRLEDLVQIVGPSSEQVTSLSLGLLINKMETVIPAQFILKNRVT